MRALLQITFAFVLVGKMIFKCSADWTVPHWHDAYYLWDKTKDLLLACCIFHTLNYEKEKRLVKLLITFFIIEIAWDILYWFKPEIATSPQVIFIDWFITILFMVSAIILTLKSTWQRKRWHG